MKVADWFQNILSRLEPSGTEVAGSTGHAQTIKTRLEQGFNLKKFMVAGSHSRGTAIRHSSDVDYFAVVSRDDARWGENYVGSSTMLQRIKKELQDRFANTEIGVDGQAVVVHFGGGDFAVDVVPAIFWEMDSNNWPIYYMPDGSNQWMKTSPEIHNQFIKKADEQSGGKLKFVIQLIKCWKFCRDVPISSFHIELLLADSGICVGVKSYRECLTEAFQLLAKRECRAYRDPKGISGDVNAAMTEAKRQSALTKTIFARDHAKSALQAEGQGDHEEAIRQWKIVFNQ